ncbi:MAG: DUF2442 domain-containing protein [Planctomycetes bacterium]|nr:DUF2442 domain-containing protein [Planctomycetota bacterium]
MVEPPRPVSVVSVVALNDLHLQLDFDDGLSRTVDVTPYVQEPQYKQVRLSEKFFKTAHIESGAVVWDNGSMLDADLLRYGPPKPPKPEKTKVAKPAKPAAKAKPKAKSVKVVKAKVKPAKAKPKTQAKKVAKAVKPVKRVAKPAAKAKAKIVKKPAKKKK